MAGVFHGVNMAICIPVTGVYGKKSGLFTNASAHGVNSSPPSAAYMRQSIRTELVRLVACHLFGIKQLPEPTLTHCQLGP